MKKAAIVTIIDNDNYGNRLQNYAVQKIIESLGYEAETLKNDITINTKKKFIIRLAKFVLNRFKFKKSERNKYFYEFNKFIKFSHNYVTPFSKIMNKYDYFIVGSDQVWNPYFGRMRDVDMLCFARDNQKISFSASFGVSNLEEEFISLELKKYLLSFKRISVREDSGKEIIEKITGRKDVKVLIDPTMLLEDKEWERVSKKPKQIKKIKTRRFILNYFLGELPNERKKEIERIAKENNCEIINILDPKDDFFNSGPSEFLWLEKNAFLIFTDSYHSCVFAILFNRPFVVFNRIDKSKSMNSRIQTLLSTFNLKDREYKDKENIDNKLTCDYSEAHKILKDERKKSKDFLKEAFNIEGENKWMNQKIEK